MFHCNGWCFTWAVTALGARHVCLRKVDPPFVWKLIADEGVTHLNGAPTVLVMLTSDPAAHVLERKVLVTTAGAPPPPAVIERTEALGFEINHVYGLTETYGPITICEWNPDWDDLDAADRSRLKARQGLAMVTADPVRVVDPEMLDVPADGETMGEVFMRGNIVMKGYLKNPAATEEAFAGGWFHSGDLAVAHPDVVQLHGHRIGERGRRGAPLGAQLVRQRRRSRFGRAQRLRRDLRRVVAVLELGKLGARLGCAGEQLLISLAAEPALRLGDAVE